MLEGLLVQGIRWGDMLDGELFRHDAGRTEDGIGVRAELLLVDRVVDKHEKVRLAGLEGVFGGLDAAQVAAKLPVDVLFAPFGVAVGFVEHLCLLGRGELDDEGDIGRAGPHLVLLVCRADVDFLGAVVLANRLHEGNEIFEHLWWRLRLGPHNVADDVTHHGYGRFLGRE